MTLRFAAAAAITDDSILQQCLAASPDILSGRLPLTLYRDHTAPGPFCNEALQDATCDWLLIVHQDVYLPNGFADLVGKAIAEIEALDSRCAVIGCIGLRADGRVAGRAWSSGLGKILGDNQDLPAPVQSIDEMLFLVRRDSGLVFDDGLPGFHLYATDIIMTARAMGLSAWVADLPAIHHSRPVTTLAGSFTKVWTYMQSKWRASLPIPNLVCEISEATYGLKLQNIRTRIRARGATRRRPPVGEPADIAKRIGWEVRPHSQIAVTPVASAVAAQSVAPC